jgi:polar amino acid transport system permease protein
MNGLTILWEARDLFISGTLTTLALIVVCLALSVPMAMLALMVFAEGPLPLANFGRLMADSLRCVPFLLFVYLVYYGLPELGLRLGPFTAGLFTLVIYNTAYFFEIFRTQAQTLPPESRMAATAFGFSRSKLYQRIVFPQLFSAAAPMLGNQAIMVMKDSALLMIITVEDITFAANFVSANQFSPFAPFVLAMTLYWLFSVSIDFAVSKLNKNFTK